MNGDVDIAAAAALLGEPARAALVLAVMEEGALPATELASRAGIAPSTASEHLGRLVDGHFLVARRDGRHRYYELAQPAVAEAVESLARVAPQRPVRSLRDATRSELLRAARTCYDHLAGRLGVELARALERERMLIRDDGSYALGPTAKARLAELEIDIEELALERRSLVRGCLDWSEGDLHVAGALGSALLDRFLTTRWLGRAPGSRAVIVTEAGRSGFAALGVTAAPTRAG